jgi:hypothetical protein
VIAPPGEQPSPKFAAQVEAAPAPEQTPAAPAREPSRDQTGVVALAVTVALAAGSVLFVRLRDPRP